MRDDTPFDNPSYKNLPIEIPQRPPGASALQSLLSGRLLTTEEVQDELLEAAIELERLSYRLHRLRQSLRLPEEIDALVEKDERADREAELYGLMARVKDEYLAVAATELRHAAQITDEQLRRRFRRPSQIQEEAPKKPAEPAP